MSDDTIVYDLQIDPDADIIYLDKSGITSSQRRWTLFDYSLKAQQGSLSLLVNAQGGHIFVSSSSVHSHDLSDKCVEF